ncbi:MAR-binding filament-like protein 1-1, partial [Primulina huaijiensis]|uniref:MAR-binding filament-like protein 1-1 n=1 Tax=Primulina huaijiensis TaxID=1492673 RepID=UPI003CC75DB6
MGFGLIPFLGMRAGALDGLAAESTESRTEELMQVAEQSVKGNTSPNSTFSLFNVVGVMASGVLGALYASTRKEKAASDATIESVNIKLKEKESAIVSLEKKFESTILNEREVQRKELAKAGEAQRSSVNQLKIANGTITSLGLELQKDRRLIEELGIKVESLEQNLSNLGNEKKELQEQLKEKLDCVAVLEDRIVLLSSEITEKADNLRSLDSKITEKEHEFYQLSSVYQQSQDRISGLISELQQLKATLSKNEKELELKNSELKNMNTELSSLVAERDESSKRLDAMVKEFEEYKSSTEKKMASDRNILGDQEKKIQHTEEQLKVALDEANKNEALVTDLTQEKENIRETLNVELKNMKSIEQELDITQETLEKSRNEAS